MHKKKLFKEERSSSSCMILLTKSIRFDLRFKPNLKKNAINTIAYLTKIMMCVPRVWFLRPTTNIQVLKERQKAIAFFHSPRNLEVVLSIQDSLKHMKCISVSKIYFLSFFYPVSIQHLMLITCVTSSQVPTQ